MREWIVREGPAMLLAAIMIPILISELWYHNVSQWGVSTQALREGRWWTLLLHVFAHGSVTHIVMNLTALFALTPIVVAFAGDWPGSWLRFAALYFGAGLAGALLYLALHPFGALPMVGASGAICGLWGAAARIDECGTRLVPIRSRQVWQNIVEFVRSNIVLFVIVLLLVTMANGNGGLAWEAHVGGFLAGLLAMPYMFRPNSIAATLLATDHSAARS